MQITRLGGITTNADTTLYQPDSIEALFVADAALTIGQAVMVDTGNSDGSKVREMTSGNDHRALGIYEGKGGSGAEETLDPTTSSLESVSGRKAVVGDIVLIKTYGRALGIVTDVSGGVADGAELIAGSTGGRLTDGTGNGNFVALEAVSATATENIPVFVKCM